MSPGTNTICFFLFSDADVNECLEGIHECAQNCHNTPESYICSCDSGYSLNADRRNCTDIDECALNRDGCTQNCQNTIGSYVCSCNVGYQLNADVHACSGKYTLYVIYTCNFIIIIYYTLIQVCGQSIVGYFDKVSILVIW